MRNRDVAEMLDRAARILALRGENRYRVRAYQRAARAVASLDESIDEIVEQNRLQSIDGVGAALADKIREIVKTGSLAMLERLETTVLPDDKINNKILLASALTFSKELLPALTKLEGISSAQLTGDTRRQKDMVAEVAVLVAADNINTAKESVSDCNFLHHQKWSGYTCRTVHSFGVQLHLYFVLQKQFMHKLWLTTGSAGHVYKVASLVKNQTGVDLRSDHSDDLQVFSTEAEIYKLINFPYIEPEMREDRGEIAAAQAARLPNLVEAADYKGDLHIHTDWSDGTASIEKMVEAAAELGYEYLAITDHSRSLKIARGLSLQRLAEQKARIESLGEKFKVRIFCGIEADILDDGSVDAPDEVLASLDVVVASVHSGFRQSRQKLTYRICRAMQNPYVQILGHATGRLLGKRDPYDVDMDEIVRTAAATQTALEINSSPDRLDITDTVARQAKDAGVLVAVNTDAHSQLELANMILGLSVARRGWLTRNDIINTKGAADVLSILRQKRNHRL